MKNLTPKQQRFVEEYLVDLNATQAAARAGYSKRTANEQGARLLANVSVAAAIAEAKAKRSEKLEITAERVLRELALIGFANMEDFMRVNGEGDPYLDFSDLTREQAAAISEVTVEDFKDGRGEDARDVRKIKFKLHDKKGALVDIGRHLGMFPNKHEHSGPGGGPIETHGSLSDLELAQRLLGIAVARGKGAAGSGSDTGDGSMATDDRSGQSGGADAAGPGAGKSGG